MRYLFRFMCAVALGVAPLVGCAETTGGVDGGDDDETVELALTLRVVGSDGVTGLPIEGAAFCENGTDNCDMTDADGLATIEIEVPADKRISYTYTKEGYGSFLYTDVVDDMLFTEGVRWTVTNETLEEQAALLDTSYPYVGTGLPSVAVAETGDSRIAGATLELVDASDTPFYFDPDFVPSFDLTSTSTYGQGGFVEVAPGEVEIRVGGTAMNCVAAQAWPGSEANTVSVPVKDGFVSFASMGCDAL